MGVIGSFMDQEAETLFSSCKASKRLAPYARAALTKLVMVHAVARIDDLRTPPGNQLKKIAGTDDVWQIRIDQQHRVASAGTARTRSTSRSATFTKDHPSHES